MQRNEAVSYLKDILSHNDQISPNAVTLDEPRNSTGYKVHIKGVTQLQTVKEIAKKHNLAVREEKDEIVVYKP